MSYINYDETYFERQLEKYWERRRKKDEEAARLAQDPKKVIRSKKDIDRLCKSFTPEQRRMQDLMLRDHEQHKRAFEPLPVSTLLQQNRVNDFDSDAFDRDILRSRGEQNVRRTHTPKESVSEDPVVYRSIAMTPDGETRCIEMRGHVPIPLPELKKMAP